ncbi:MAG TPA: SGNH/GDSL hydrolase family protein [Acidimicrobiales bacterium]|nr:SGNH/GDSL hydrolase family protein [Acidimicrobiales bacterium]
MNARSFPTRWSLAAALLALVAGVVAMPVADAAPSANAGPKTMVALGDSFAAGPLIPPQVDERPWGCLRSSLNYAHQIASALSLELTDVTCSGASTKHLWETHGVSPDAELVEEGVPVLAGDHPGNPPQLDALRPDTDVVTLQIGGNDMGFGGIATTCAEAALTLGSCKAAVEAERPFDRIAQTAPKLRAVLAEIHRRSPQADVHVLGYPGIFAMGETASCPAMGVGEEDARYLRSIQEALNGMIRSVADEAGHGYSDATGYVDVYAPSAGHTACDLPAIRWVEPFVPVNAAAPVHPNLGGMTAIRDLLLDEVWPEGIPRRAALPGLPAPPSLPG